MQMRQPRPLAVIAMISAAVAAAPLIQPVQTGFNLVQSHATSLGNYAAVQVMVMAAPYVQRATSPTPVCDTAYSYTAYGLDYAGIGSLRPALKSPYNVCTIIERAL